MTASKVSPQIYQHFSQNMDDRPALLGGSAALARPWPEWPQYGPEEEAGLLEVLHSREWGGYNPHVPELESKFAARHACRYGVAMANGTLTLVAALRAAGIGNDPQDEVIVPPYTFFASASAVLLAGATVRFADVDPHTLTLDPAAVEAAITPRTRAIMPVHFAGQPAALASLLELCQCHNLILLEDAAQSHGATYREKPVGSWGQLASFSFQASKNMTAGEGGMIVTNDPQLAEGCWAQANQGRKPGGKWYEHYELGANYRLGGFQAAVLLAQLERLDAQVARRQANAAILEKELLANPHLGLTPVGRAADTTDHAYHIFVTRYNPEALQGLPRRRFLEALAAEGVPCSAGYPVTLPEQPVFAQARVAGRVKGGEPASIRHSRQAVEEVVWFIQRVLLGDREDTYNLLGALERLSRHAASL